MFSYHSVCFWFVLVSFQSCSDPCRAAVAVMGSNPLRAQPHCLLGWSSAGEWWGSVCVCVWVCEGGDIASDRSLLCDKRAWRGFLLQGHDTACQHITFVGVRERSLRSWNASQIRKSPPAVCTKLIKLGMGILRNLTILFVSGSFLVLLIKKNCS